MLTESLEAEDLQEPLTPRLRTAQHPQFFSMPTQWLYLSWGVTIIGGDEKEKERWEEEEILPWIWGEKGGKREWKRRVMRERGRERERERGIVEVVCCWRLQASSSPSSQCVQKELFHHLLCGGWLSLSCTVESVKITKNAITWNLMAKNLVLFPFQENV